MKNITFSILLLGNIAFSQVGIDTETPQTTLDINGNLQLRSELKINGNDITEGNPGISGQALVSQGENQPLAWKDILVPFIDVDQHQLTHSYSEIDNIGISFPVGNGDGIHISEIDDPLNSNWTVIEGLNSNITIENPDNKISLIFQSGVELSQSLIKHNSKYMCGAFFNGKLKAMRPNQIDSIGGKPKNQSMITLSYNIFDLEPGNYAVQIACRKISSSSSNLRLAIGRPAEGLGSVQSNNFSMQSILKIDILEKLNITLN